MKERNKMPGTDRDAMSLYCMCWLVACVLFCSLPTVAFAQDEVPDQQESPATETTAEPTAEPKRRLFPLYREWFEEQNINLPPPYGAGLALIYMDRGVDVDDVRVQFGNRPPESIIDRADFSVNNETVIVSGRADLWVLPFINVYLMAGKTQSEALLQTVISIPTPGPGDPVETEVAVNQDVSGPFLGAGITAIAGYGDWFGMLDANYGESDLDKFEGTLGVWLYSGRFGRMVNLGGREAMFWGGVIYLDSKRTINIQQDLPILGTTRISVDQRPTDPVTWQMGGSLSFTNGWNLLAEVGLNSDRDFLMVATSTYRW